MAVRQFLIPARDWRVRVYALYVFILQDYLMTGAFCKDFADEANLLVRASMIYFDDVQVGLLVFALAFYGPVYAVLCLLTNRDWDHLRGTSLFEFLSERRRPIFDVALGLGVASRHFEGGMSWVLPLSNRLWLPLGFIAYLTLVHIGTLKTRVG
ncbi:MAG: hypothetical protein JSV27_07660 [Candidatus Bathyarchaeota archaeon]|nr:MAG: hypothetical protein JSV27_07660 [Candidatus Bathyarchaeota archaeon]